MKNGVSGPKNQGSAGSNLGAWAIEPKTLQKHPENTKNHQNLINFRGGHGSAPQNPPKNTKI
jgi:hypothetical protein